MDLFCLYCYEAFNTKLNLPMELSCKHILCSSCIQYLKDYQYPQTCPLDNEIIHYSSAKPCQKPLKLITYACPTHKSQFKAFCKNHFQLLCESCLENHQCCLKIVGRVDELENFMCDTIQQSKDKAKIMLSKSKNDYVGEMSDGINWIKYEINTKVSEIREMLKVRNIREIVKLDFTYLENLLQEVEKSINSIENIFKIEVRSPEENETRNDQKNIPISEIKNNQEIELANNDELGITFKRLIEERWSTGKSNDEYIKHLVNISDREFKKIRSKIPILLIFSFLYPIEHIEDDCTMVIENSYHMPILVLGFSIGMPIDSNGCIFIERITIMYENSIQEIQSIILRYISGQLTHIIHLESLIIWTPNSRIIFSAYFQCSRSFLFFTVKKSKFLKVYDIDGNEFKGYSPFFGFIVDSLD
ncbi:hypothetical protein SteCoe_37479 [Stentor coeruleus]|uniref:RING-type domain-containing protein n=1 Tax=Stentor coeruleus TaxID=5963 RepID=A0A1R2AMZ5_9CILI|nr:hypothetical protein SteCoe_37479 [Stentor coeruleus]